MSDSQCCSCAYATPPWWVTMGFIPPNNGSNTKDAGSSHTGATTTTSTQTQQPTQTQQTTTQSSNPLGGIINTVGSLLGGLL